jgi:hypothetical protein
MAQSDNSFGFLREIKGDIAAFTVDNLDNIYILSSRNQVKKINANGDSVAVYNDVRRYGLATLMDASNPLKVLLYYRDFSTIVVLDRLLNIRNTIDLRRQNIFQVKAIGQSYDNKIWVYDELDNKLKKIDDDGKLLQETPDFRLLFLKPYLPVSIFDQDKFVYLYDPKEGVYVFDYFGTIKNGIQIQGWQNLKVSGKYIFGSKTDTLYRYDIDSFQYDEWKMPLRLEENSAFNFTTTRLYALAGNKIAVYSFR